MSNFFFGQEGAVAQWKEQLTADQMVPRSIRGSRLVFFDVSQKYVKSYLKAHPMCTQFP